MADDTPKAAERLDEEQPEEEKREEEADPFVSSTGRRPSLRRGPSLRPDHFQKLVRQRRASIVIMDQIYEGTVSTVAGAEAEIPTSLKDVLTESNIKQLEAKTETFKQVKAFIDEFRKHFPLDQYRVEVRLKDFSYRVDVDPFENKIQTVYNQSFVYDMWKFARRVFKHEKKPEKKTKYVLQDINLNFEPGKTYLVLGPPASGKTTLLKAISGRLSTANGEVLEGSILYNGLSLKVRPRYTINGACVCLLRFDAIRSILLI